MSFRSDANNSAKAWKANTTWLPPEASMVAFDDSPTRQISINPGFSAFNLLPAAQSALEWFTSGAIAWHQGKDGGPTTHLLSSQVQCVNALAPMAYNSNALRWFFDGVLDIAEALPVGTPEAPDAFVAFEWIGHDNPLGEWGKGNGKRGIGNTSADAVIRYRTSPGIEEMALIEWKYVEKYSNAYDHEKGRRWLERYAPLLADTDCPIRQDLDPLGVVCTGREPCAARQVAVSASGIGSEPRVRSREVRDDVAGIAPPTRSLRDSRHRTTRRRGRAHNRRIQVSLRASGTETRRPAQRRVKNVRPGAFAGQRADRRRSSRQ